MASLTLFDLATLMRNDPYTGLVEDVTTLAPEFSTISAIPRSGYFYELVRRTALPTAQFRRVNEGVTPSKSKFKKEVKEMFFLDVALNVDEAIIKGQDGTPGEVWMLEAEGAMRSAAIQIGAQTYYGTSSDAFGFAGLRAQCAGSVAAGGTTNTTSAYLLWMDPKFGVRYEVGRDGNFAISPPVRQQVADANNSGKNYFAFVGNLSAYVGLTVVSDKAVWAVTGIDGGSTNILSDAVAASLIANIPAARRQNLRWFLNRTAEYSLQKSRTTVNPGITTYSAAYSMQPADAAGRPAWSPKPNSCEGYPVTLTDSLTNTESN